MDTTPPHSGRKRSYAGHRYGKSKRTAYRGAKFAKRTGARFYKQPKQWKQDGNSCITKFVVSRDCATLGVTGKTAAGDISLFETAYASTLPTNGAMTFSIADIDATKLAAYTTVYAQARLNAVLVQFLPAATTSTIQHIVNTTTGTTPNVANTGPLEATLVYDPDTSQLEVLQDLQAHNTAKVYAGNACREIKRLIKPRLIETVEAESDGGTIVQVAAASKKPPWISVGPGSNLNATRVRHFGLKWDVRPEIATVVTQMPISSTYTAGSWHFTYYIGWRFSC